MSLETEGLTLFEAARKAGVSFAREVAPQDKELTINGLRLHYLDWGNESKQSILLFHGGAQQAHSWDFIALSLCDSYHVLSLDARGHGDSQWAPDGDYSIEAHQRDLDGFVEALGGEGSILVGHSMGGTNGYIYASRHPEKVKALVIVDEGPGDSPEGQSRIRRFLELPDELGSYEEFAERIQEFTGRPKERVMGALKYSIRQRDDGKWTWKYDKRLRAPGRRYFNWPDERLWECLAQIKCPCLIIRGANSDLFPKETMERMLRVIPDSTSATVPNAGHRVTGQNPTGFLEALNAMLARVG